MNDTEKLGIYIFYSLTAFLLISLVIFIVSADGKRHAGNEFRGFWIGAAIGVLIFGILFAVNFLAATPD